MSNEYQTIKIYRTTLKALRLLAALRGMSMVAVVDQLVIAALEDARRMAGQEQGEQE